MAQLSDICITNRMIMHVDLMLAEPYGGIPEMCMGDKE